MYQGRTGYLSRAPREMGNWFSLGFNHPPEGSELIAVGERCAMTRISERKVSDLKKGHSFRPLCEPARVGNLFSDYRGRRAKFAYSY